MDLVTFSSWDLQEGGTNDDESDDFVKRTLAFHGCLWKKEEIVFISTVNSFHEIF